MAKAKWLERAEGEGRDSIFRYESSWRNEENPSVPSELSLGNLDRLNGAPLARDMWLEFPYCGGSDYSGECVTVANYRAMKERFRRLRTVKPTYGGHDSYGIVVRLDCRSEEVWETLRRLREYPVIDEELLSEVDSEYQDRAWDSYIRGDFLKSVADRYAEELTEDESDTLTSFSFTATEEEDRAIRETFESAREVADEDWYEDSNGCGASQAIRYERVAAQVTVEEARRLASILS